MAAMPKDFTDLYDELLREYWRPSVTIHGVETTVFDYAQMAKDAGQASSRFAEIDTVLANIDLQQLSDEDVAKSFWINVYNYGAMRLVVLNYPVQSIRSLKISLVKYPWSKKVIRVGQKYYSLSQIEKDILLPQFGDPRIIFAVSCAAVSCPDRIPEAFRPQRLDAQLDTMIRRFFSHPKKGLSLDKATSILTLSWILKKEAELFASHPAGVLGFVGAYVADDLRQWLATHDVKLEYFDHDWSLNDSALADNLH